LDTRLLSVLGLGFGDCGKGLFIDSLARRCKAHTVVRFNGGGQAGHNVVLPDGRHHTFSQFGAGSFVAGVATVLASPVVLHPGALLVEAAVLAHAGVADPLARLHIDARCRVTTPFHQAAGRLRELRRGPLAHGSCGVGFGETVGHGLAHPDQALRYGDLLQPALALDKLEAIRRALLAQFGASRPDTPAWHMEWAALRDPTLARRWLAHIAPLLAQVAPQSRDAIGARLHLPGTVLFEGAQGVLLDEARGFHPHTTWSSISTAAVEAVARDAGQTAPIEHYGALRSYMTRHGAGPLPTHDGRLDALSEPHNDSNSGEGWQGAFRRGHPDAVLLRYALAVVGPLDGLLVSHLDAFERGVPLHWCDAYEVEDQGHRALIGGIVPGRRGDLEHQAALSAMLRGATPRYRGAPIAGAAAFIDDLAALARLPVVLRSRGPTHAQVEGCANFRTGAP
jgi:adenylosuccinate synthase